MDKIKLSQVVVVEGKYDAIKLDSILDALIIPVNGFTIYRDDEKKSLLRSLGKTHGIVLVTDSDTAGFKIRNYVSDICSECEIYNVYMPKIRGKESRKEDYSKEGFLGVEGISVDIIKKCFEDAGVTGTLMTVNKSTMTYSDLYTLGLSGTPNASKNREIVCRSLGIPTGLSKKSFLEVLNRMTDINDLQSMLNEKPVLFWDFHGTLTIPDNQWIDGALKAYRGMFPEIGDIDDEIVKNLGGKCLPWWTYPDRDTRHLVENDGWWKSCETEFLEMYISSGLTKQQAKTLSPMIRPYVVNANNHRLHSDALSTLSELKKRGYRSYILSNNFPELPEMCKEMGLDEYFCEILVSANIGYDKPRKEIFDIAKEIAGNPHRCIMIGDNPVDDIMGAKLAGFETILANDRHPDYNGDYCDNICKTLSEILDVLK